MTTRLIVFASGTGSNFEALAEYFADRPDVALVGLVCDHKAAPVLAKAEAAHVPTILIDYRAYPTKAAAEAALVARLPQADGLVLAGFMRIIGPTLLAAFPERIINLHPALLPSFPGRSGIADAFAYGVKVTGVTVHFVDAGIDSGRIIAQEPVRMRPDDTLATLETRIHEVEHHLLPTTVDHLIEKGVF
ncbi:phosphoribosylglycinamide formyltransferase [Lacticaseibacillus yichunensis]|uniref:Phosphoribosylglycinamide formyltransferase n=1 Tax=Lacticaseibacillus yichunensis TaxID=2486015 RepID=A0ABW4CLZ1_9LACO|nr:phosphoribosylglycinamide formyltransferase [Lacticaseibacillus yichunensis]